MQPGVGYTVHSMTEMRYREWRQMFYFRWVQYMTEEPQKRVGHRVRMRCSSSWVVAEAA
jgi:hypothetical protein